MLKFTNGTQAKPYLKDLYGKPMFDQITRYDGLISTFKRKFKQKYCFVATSSGRIEIVGNHTDHNGGKVLGCAISFDILAGFLPNDSGKVRIKSEGHADIAFDLESIYQLDGGSLGMVKGVLAYLKDHGYNIGGFDAVLQSTLPSGVGISSSAAFQSLMGAIQSHLYNDGAISAETIARAGQFAENNYFKKPCGLLDQGVIAVGGVVTIDFKTGFDATHIDELPIGHDFVLINTGGNHATLTAHYKAITDEMRLVANHFGCDKLIEVDEQQFFQNYDQIVEKYGIRPALRAKHFFEENHVVETAIQALKNGDMCTFIAMVNKSGDSSLTQLQNCSTGDCDTVIPDAIALARQICPSCGCRVHGGGFAGTILAVVPTQETANFVQKMSQKYGENSVYVLKARALGATVL